MTTNPNHDPVTRITEGVDSIQGEIGNVSAYADDLAQAVQELKHPEQPLTDDEHFFARHRIKETAGHLLRACVSLTETVETVAEAGVELMEGETTRSDWEANA